MSKRARNVWGDEQIEFVMSEWLGHFGRYKFGEYGYDMTPQGTTTKEVNEFCQYLYNKGTEKNIWLSTPPKSARAILQQIRWTGNPSAIKHHAGTTAQRNRQIAYGVGLMSQTDILALEKTNYGDGE